MVDAIVDESVSPLPYDARAEALALIQTTKDADSCSGVADDGIKNVNDAVDADQEILDALPDGSKCAAQARLNANLSSLEDDVKNAQAAVDAAAKELEAAMNVPLEFPYKFFLKPDSCPECYAAAHYQKAKVRADAAIAAKKLADAALANAKAVLASAQADAANLKSACLCDAKHRYDQIIEVIYKNRDDNKKVWEKSYQIKCMLANDANCQVPAVPLAKDKGLIPDARNAKCEAPQKAPEKCKGVDVPYTKGKNGVLFTWASPCSGGCSKATPQCGWGICTPKQWEGLPSEQMKKDKPCSSKIFDQKYGHCDPSNKFVRVEDGSYNELVFCHQG